MQGSWKLIEDLRYVKHISKKKNTHKRTANKILSWMEIVFFFSFFFVNVKNFENSRRSDQAKEVRLGFSPTLKLVCLVKEGVD